MSEHPADHPHHQIPEDMPLHSLDFRTASLDHTTNAGDGTKNTKFCVVNMQDGLAEMIQAIGSQEQTTLYVAVEASLLALHVHPEPGCSYIVDLDALGATAFEPCEALNAAQEAAAETGPEQPEHQASPVLSLRAILEGNSIPKVLFDCRQACAFLAGRFGVRMGSVEDIQCLEFVSRPSRLSEEQQEAAVGVGERDRDLRSCLE